LHELELQKKVLSLGPNNSLHLTITSSSISDRIFISCMQKDKINQKHVKLNNKKI